MVFGTTASPAGTPPLPLLWVRRMSLHLSVRPAFQRQHPLLVLPGPTRCRSNSCPYFSWTDRCSNYSISGWDSRSDCCRSNSRPNTSRSDECPNSSWSDWCSNYRIPCWYSCSDCCRSNGRTQHLSVRRVPPHQSDGLVLHFYRIPCGYSRSHCCRSNCRPYFELDRPASNYSTLRLGLRSDRCRSPTAAPNTSWSDECPNSSWSDWCSNYRIPCWYSWLRLLSVNCC
jgi:hypothetical protein